MHETSPLKPKSTPESTDQARNSEEAVRTPSLEQPLTAALLLHLQRTAGNTAVNTLLRQREHGGDSTVTSGHGAGKGKVGTPASDLGKASTSAVSRLAVQRHPEGEALPQKSDLVTEVTKKEAPAATRSLRQEKTDKQAATTEGTAEKARQALTPGAMSLATAQTILTGAFGGVKTIVPGAIVILADQPACAAKYDEVCIAAGIVRDDGTLWKAGDCAADDAAAGVQTEGFAWEGTVYVNGKTTLITATAHEMLHLNAAANYRGIMGETFNEGSTEFLARKAIAAAGISVPAVTAYPVQIEITMALIALVGEDALTVAYFGGGATLKDLVRTKAKGTWDQIRAAAEALEVDNAKNYLKSKA